MNPAERMLRKLLPYICLIALTTVFATGCTSQSVTTYAYTQFADNVIYAANTGIQIVTSTKDEVTDDISDAEQELTATTQSDYANDTPAPENAEATDANDSVEEIADIETPLSSCPKTFNLYCRYHGESQAEIDAGGIVEYYPNYYASH